MKPELKRVNDRFLLAMNNCIAKKECENKGDFARKIKIEPATLSHIGHYKQTISTQTLIELRKVFDISIHYILFGEGPERVSQPKKDTIEDLINRVIDLERKCK